MPFVAFSQQTDSKKQVQKKQTTISVENKQLQAEPTPVSESKAIDLELYRKTNNVPDDFPRYQDTGNPKIDESNYHDAKQEWIKNNPARFEKIKHLAL